VIYSRVLERYGVEYVRDNSEIDCAQCRSLFYEKGNPPEFDWRTITDDEARATLTEGNVTVVDLRVEDNKYLHRDFHLLGDNALAYCGERWGDEAVIDFLKDFTRSYYAPVIDRARKEGLAALAEWIEGIYETRYKECNFHSTNVRIS
jgi:hypothetical protein